MFSNGGSTSPDVYIGALCILVFIVCSFLNLVVFKHVSGKKKSLASCLYLTLSSADFITAWVITLTYGIHVLARKVDECRNSNESSCNEDYYKKLTVASLGQKVHAILGWIVCVAPSNITAFLAMSRFYQIKYPLRQPRIVRVMVALVLSLVPLLIITGCATFGVDEANNSIPYYVTVTNQAWNFHPKILEFRTNCTTYYLLIIGGTWVLEVGAILTSILTINEIVRRRIKPISGEIKGQKTRKTLKILIMNTGNISILVIMTIVAFYVKDDYNDISLYEGVWYLMINVIIPSLISTLNPIIYIGMTPKCNLRTIVGAIRRPR